ncbi:1-acyl-sn-glycerol-3-phosphate acyltransferase [Methylophilaceae bacterium]|nr:1-acyl-sn-glycerol-3-phosphate acyltransferase [Methylophilaceae bacterium]
MVLHTLYGIFIASIILPGLGPRRRDLVISRWSRALLDLLNIRIVTHGEIPPVHLTNAMFVANHISWIDIHALNSVRTSRFVAKSEIRRWPVFGWFAEKTNTLFIDREKRQDAARIVNITTEALRAGDCICFFPEGTTTDGTELKPFKGSLLQAAIEANSQVWPVSIWYPEAGGEANTDMAYWGEMNLIESMRLIIQQHSPVVELHFSSPIDATARERRHLSTLVRQAVAAKLNFPR